MFNYQRTALLPQFQIKRKCIAVMIEKNRYLSDRGFTSVMAGMIQ